MHIKYKWEEDKEEQVKGFKTLKQCYCCSTELSALHLQQQRKELLRSGLRLMFVILLNTCIAAMKRQSTATRSEYKPKVLWSSSSAWEEPRGQGNSTLEKCPSAKRVPQAKPRLCHRSDLDKRGQEQPRARGRMCDLLRNFLQSYTRCPGDPRMEVPSRCPQFLGSWHKPAQGYCPAQQEERLWGQQAKEVSEACLCWKWVLASLTEPKRQCRYKCAVGKLSESLFVLRFLPEDQWKTREKLIAVDFEPGTKTWPYQCCEPLQLAVLCTYLH